MQVLLSHPPIDCSAAVVTAWNALLAECGTFNGQCCPTCTIQSTAHCDEGYESDDTVYATAYTVVATVLLLNAIT